MKKILSVTAIVLLSVLLVVLCVNRPDVPVQAVPAMTSPAPGTTPAITPEPVPEATPFISPDADKLKISELMAKNRATIQDEDGDFSDWFEIENISDDKVSLSGWSVSDTEAEVGWAFPELTLAPGERLLVFASGKDRSGSELHTDFSLSPDETLYLYAPTDYLADSAVSASDESDRSSIRQPDGSFAVCSWPTPGYANDLDSYAQYCSTRSCSSPLVINEAMVYNTSVNRQADGEYYDWVELKNVSEEPVELSDYYLSDDKNDYLLWQLPERSLAPGACIVIYCSGNEDLSTDANIHSNFSLNSVSESLFLSSAAQKCVVDYVWLHDLGKGQTMGRIDGENGYFYLSTPTPGSDNYGTSYRSVTPRPDPLTEPGIYNDVESVVVELDGDGAMYYTLDGSIPTLNSTPYTEPITLTATTVVRAIAVHDGSAPSRALSASYIINENHTLPVLSLATDDPGTFSYIYWQKIKYTELPVNISFYEEDGSFSMDCGIKMKGWTSLDNPKKSMGVKFRGCYGDDMLDYDIFGSDVTEFGSLSIRAGQDYPLAIIRDELFQELCLEMGDNVPTQESRYCILYLNGSYRGIYCIKEDISRQYYASHKGVSKDEVIVQRSPAALDSLIYQEVYNYIRDNDMSIDENYDHICSVIDIDSVIDWFILEGYCANSDINGNMRYFKTIDGKWQIVFYDLDWTFNLTGNCFYNITSYDRNLQVTQLINNLIKNAKFRDRLLTRYAEVISTTLSNEHVLAKIDELADYLAPEVPRERSQWGSSVEGWNYRLNELRSFITDNDYEKFSVYRLCYILGVSDAERIEYFGF